MGGHTYFLEGLPSGTSLFGSAFEQGSRCSRMSEGLRDYTASCWVKYQGPDTKWLRLERHFSYYECVWKADLEPTLRQLRPIEHASAVRILFHRGLQ